jgi:hypothetical protein
MRSEPRLRVLHKNPTRLNELLFAYCALKPIKGCNSIASQKLAAVHRVLLLDCLSVASCQRLIAPRQVGPFAQIDGLISSAFDKDGVGGLSVILAGE